MIISFKVANSHSLKWLDLMINSANSHRFLVTSTEQCSLLWVALIVTAEPWDPAAGTAGVRHHLRRSNGGCGDSSGAQGRWVLTASRLGLSESLSAVYYAVFAGKDSFKMIWLASMVPPKCGRISSSDGSRYTRSWLRAPCSPLF